MPLDDSRDTRPTYSEGRPAVFLDRDGTIIAHVHYLADPREVRLISGAAAAIRDGEHKRSSLVAWPRYDEPGMS